LASSIAVSDLVSIITPVCDGESFIAATIESVLGQSYGHWELIVVDDGSTDGTARMVASFEDPRLCYIYQDNQGLAAARNAGIDLARGEFLAFLDADDMWSPRFLRTCVDYLSERQQIAAVYTASSFVDSQGCVLPQQGDASWSGPELHDRLLEGGFFPPNAVLARTEVVKAVGLFDADLKGHGTEDWDLWLRIASRYPMHGLAEPLAYYRVYPGSMSTDTTCMHANRIAVLAKHFGPPDEEPCLWSEDKRRAYGFAYRATALGFIQHGSPDRGWHFLNRAVAVHPQLLERLDTFYELVCGDQPRGYRGEADQLNLEEGGAEVIRNLERLFEEAPPRVKSQQRTAYGNTFWALSMLADQAGQWRLARRYLWQAMKQNWLLATRIEVMRRLSKLSLGTLFFAERRN
jgi:hypothetical protein